LGKQRLMGQRGREYSRIGATLSISKFNKQELDIRWRQPRTHKNQKPEMHHATNLSAIRQSTTYIIFVKNTPTLTPIPRPFQANLNFTATQEKKLTTSRPTNNPISVLCRIHTLCHQRLASNRLHRNTIHDQILALMQPLIALLATPILQQIRRP
jgi:hypothetical protein